MATAGHLLHTMSKYCEVRLTKANYVELWFDVVVIHSIIDTLERPAKSMVQVFIFLAFDNDLIFV